MMNAQRLSVEIDRLAAQPGIVGCALVDAETGLVWCASGRTPEGVWEAAVDYWRLHARQQAHFESLGALRAAVMYHEAGMLTIMPCATTPTVLLVAIGRHKSVDWRQWQLEVKNMNRLMAEPMQTADRAGNAQR